MLHYRLHRDPRSSHQQIARLLRSLHPQAILDVGAAQGFLGQLLQGSGLLIDAVEPDPGRAQHALPFYRRVYACPIDSAELPGQGYDVIVCADVLEHLIDPAAALCRLRRCARDGAVVIVSLPNVAHVAIRLMLLAGRFPQMDRGILDRTHLHFYTLDTARSLLLQAGLTVQRTLATAAPLEEIWPPGEGTWLFRAAMRLQHVLVDIVPRLFAYQWIFLARWAEG